MVVEAMVSAPLLSVCAFGGTQRQQKPSPDVFVQKPVSLKLNLDLKATLAYRKVLKERKDIGKVS